MRFLFSLGVFLLAAATIFALNNPDAVTLKWSLRRWGGTRSFFGSGPVPLVARAPLTPGRYTLVVAAHGHRDSALVLVRKGR